MASFANWFQGRVNRFESTRFGSMGVMIIAQSVWAAIAGATCLWREDYILLSIMAFLAMGTNAAFISQSRGKYCLAFLYSSIVVASLINLSQVIHLALVA